MSENNKSEPFAAAGSGKSDAEVAFDLLNKLKGQGVWGERNMPTILDMYAECLDAVKGYRVYNGQSRVEAPIRRASNTPDIAISGDVPRTAPTQSSAPAAQPSIPTMPAQPQQQARAPQASPENSVQAQQAQLQQQLYKQG